jgi:hypothetical protein
MSGLENDILRLVDKTMIRACSLLFLVIPLLPGTNLIARDTGRASDSEAAAAVANLKPRLLSRI